MILGFVAGILSILGTFLVLSAAFLGVGLAIRRALGPTTVGLDDCFLAFWVGYGSILLFLILWHFVLPVGLPALSWVLAIGGAGILWSRRALAEMFERDAWHPNRRHLLLLILAGVWVAQQSMRGFRSWDGALYHLQSVKWAEAYAVVPGIANLYGPLAFNNASFLYCAMLDSGWWAGRGFHVANGLLVFVMVLQAIVAAARFMSSAEAVPRSRLYAFLLLAPTLHLAFGGELSSYSTDLPVTLLLLAATARMYALLDVNPSQSPTTEDAYGVVALSVLLAAAVCIKMSAGVFAAVALPVAALSWWRRAPRPDAGSIWTLGWATTAVLVFAMAWMGRGVVMSGYPLFPLSVGGFPVDWRAPVEHAEAELANVGFTEREFSWTIGRRWLGSVVFGDPYAVFIPSGLAVGALLALAIYKLLGHERRLPRRQTWWLLLSALAAIGAWLWSAPALRYSVAFFWTVAAVCICECHRAVWPALGSSARRWVLVGLVALGVSPPLVEPVLDAVRNNHNLLGAILSYNLIRPGPDNGFHPIAERADVATFTTASGLLVNVPRKPTTRRGSAQFWDDRAKPWDAPIPTTPNPAPNLRLREPGRLEKGFAVDGDWQMQDWPYYWRESFLAEWRRRRSGAGASR